MPFPSTGDLPSPGIEPVSPTLWADALPSEPPGKWELPSVPFFLTIEFLKDSKVEFSEQDG